MVVISRQPLTHLPVADYESVVNLPEMSNLDNVTKLGNFVVFREFDTVWLVKTLRSLCIFTVVHKLELCEKDDCSGREEVRGGGLRWG